MARSVPPAAAIALWSLQALAAGYWLFAYQCADDDTGLAVRLARACVERGVCVSAGTPASGLGLSHGATWIRLIGYCLTTDGGLGTLQWIVLALLTAATVVAGVVVWRTLSWRAGMFASLLVLPGTMATLRFDDLTNGVILPLPLALYFACTAWFVRSGGLLPVLAASAALAAAMSPSLSCILLVPLHLALVGLAARKPLSAALLAMLAGAATFTLESSEAAAQLERVLVRQAAVALGLLGVAVGAAAVSRSGRTLLRRIGDLTTGWRDRFLALPPPVRLRAAMKLAAAYLITAGWVGPLTASGLRIPDAHFFAAAVFPLVFLAADAMEPMSPRGAAVLIGALVVALGSLVFAPLAVAVGSVLCVLAAAVVLVTLLARALRLRGGAASDLTARPSARVAVAGTVLVCAMSTPDALLYPRTRQLWPVVTAETMVRRLYGSGLTYPELMSALQGQAPYTLQAMIASLDPEVTVDRPLPADGTPSLLAMIVDPAIAARARDVLARVDDVAGRTAIAVRSPSVLDRVRLRTCYAGSCDEPMDPGRCITRDPHGLVRHDRPYFPVAEVDAASRFHAARNTTYCVRFLVPLRMPGAGKPHWLRVPQLWPLEARIRRVTGVAFEGTLPGPEVRLHDDRSATGMVEVEAFAHGLGPESDWLEEPPVIDVDAANEPLLEPYREGRVTLR